MNGFSVDLHSHVLPEMDDGSRSVAESLEMLAASAKQGIRYMAATSHFYPGENSPERYLERRAKSLEKLNGALTGEHPKLLPGAEVYYFEGISRNEAVESLRIGDTGLLLLEMPFSPWTERMVEDVLRLNRRHGITVLMAHIERYFRFAQRSDWDLLLEDGVLMQSNADFFLSWKTRRKALRMLKEGRIHFIASDAHNMGSRSPRVGEALEAIGSEGRQVLEENVLQYLPGLQALETA